MSDSKRAPYTTVEIVDYPEGFEPADPESQKDWVKQLNNPDTPFPIQVGEEYRFVLRFSTGKENPVRFTCGYNTAQMNIHVITEQQVEISEGVTDVHLVVKPFRNFTPSPSDSSPISNIVIRGHHDYAGTIGRTARDLRLNVITVDKKVPKGTDPVLHVTVDTDGGPIAKGQDVPVRVKLSHDGGEPFVNHGNISDGIVVRRTKGDGEWVFNANAHKAGSHHFDIKAFVRYNEKDEEKNLPYTDIKLPPYTVELDVHPDADEVQWTMEDPGDLGGDFQLGSLEEVTPSDESDIERRTQKIIDAIEDSLMADTEIPVIIKNIESELADLKDTLARAALHVDPEVDSD